MKVAIMQPYFLPYIGYFQIINAVDQFVVYDNIEYTKKSWIHRNRLLLNGKDTMFSVPLKKDSDYLNVVQRKLADNYDYKVGKILRKIEASYRKTPFYRDIMPLVQTCFQRNSDNLFEFIYASLKEIIGFLEIQTRVVVSSTLDIDHTLKAQNKVLAICKNLHADMYINPPGGRALYAPDAFKQEGIELRFLNPRPIEYKQFDQPFIPFLSIIDVLMFNSKDQVRQYLEHYDLTP